MQQEALAKVELLGGWDNVQISSVRIDVEHRVDLLGACGGDAREGCIDLGPIARAHACRFRRTRYRRE
jgi:hypothetical protein